MSYLRAEFFQIREVSAPQNALGRCQLAVPVASAVATVSATPLAGGNRITVPDGANVAFFRVFAAGTYGVAVKSGPDATFASQAAAKSDPCTWLQDGGSWFPLPVNPGDVVTAVDASLP